MIKFRYPTIQNLAWPASQAAIKNSENFAEFDAFYSQLTDSLPQNSPETRRKYARIIRRRFFPEHSLTSLLPQAWHFYHDEKILADLMRVYALNAEPVMAKFVLEHLEQRQPGDFIEKELLKQFVINLYGEFEDDSYTRLIDACREMGFLDRYNNALVVQRLTPSKDAFLLLLHDRMAPTPRIVQLSEILEATWCHYLGLRDPVQIRNILHQAEAAELVARFVKVDELEQVTTRYSRDEYLKRKLRLPERAFS